MRVKFRKGKQREFIRQVLVNTLCPSLRAFKQFGLEINYSTLKSYYSEDRTMPDKLFYDLCKLGRINHSSLKVRYLNDNWGKVRGGRK